MNMKKKHAINCISGMWSQKLRIIKSKKVLLDFLITSTHTHIHLFQCPSLMEGIVATVAILLKKKQLTTLTQH